MTTHPRSVILLEFNELCPTLMERFIDAGYLPNFARLYRESEIYTTTVPETGEDLNPWVQWVTVHCGVPAGEHFVKTLADGQNLKYSAVWDLVSEKGHNVWICGSMNAKYTPPLNGFLLPDPWCVGVTSYPSHEFTPYFDFVRSAVQEHTRNGGTGSARAFLKYLLSHGLTARSLMQTVRQVVSEKFAVTHWKRAAIMDLLQWDVFCHYYRLCQPAFATFFINSTAHLQHCYWRHMEPSQFSSVPTEHEQRTYGNAILFGYRAMDRLVKRCLEVATPNTTIMFCTAMGQQPCTEWDATGGRHYYRLKSPNSLHDTLGVHRGCTYEPLMADQFALRFPTESDAIQAESLLNEYSVLVTETETLKAFHVQRESLRLVCQCNCTTMMPPAAKICGNRRQVPFFDLFYKFDTIKSGRHHPDGMLWIRRPTKQHRVHPSQVSLCAIAPTALTELSVPIPEYMRHPPLQDVDIRHPDARSKVFPHSVIN